MKPIGYFSALVALAQVAPAVAQQASVDQRVGKLEKEMKAVQRTLFPLGVPVQPELGGATGPTTPAGDIASGPISDLSVRVDALEKSLTAVTGQIEQNTNRLRIAEGALGALEARVKALEPQSLAGLRAATATPATAGAVRAPDSSTPPAVADRKTAVAAIEMPVTNDAAEDAYTYAFRLYSAKFYPEAEANLKEFVARYPKHKRASYAQNLLGRAYLDEGKPALASVAFYDNYQKMPKGDRASESLYWLGQSLTRLKKLPDACKVYDELDDVYGATLSGDLKARTLKGRADAKCPG